VNEGPYGPDRPEGEGGQPPSEPGDIAPIPAPPPPPVPVTPTAATWEAAAPPPPSARGQRRGKLVAIVVAALVVIGGLAFGAVKIFHSVAGTSDVLAKMVPADADVYLTAYLDPGAGQKLNLRNLAHKFPAAAGKDLGSTLDRMLDQALSSTGLSYIRDVKPWLGTQLAVAVSVKNGAPQAVVLVSSKDDARAQTTLLKARDQLLGQSGLRWTTQTHGGVTVNVGEAGGAPQAAYAVVDHTVVLSNTPSLVDQVIDTAQGHGSNLNDDDAFQATVAGLPKDVLGRAFVSPGLITKLPGLAGGFPIGGFPGVSGVTGLPGLPSVAPLTPGATANPLAQPGAFRGLGASLSAESNGLALDLSVALDSSKLSGPQKEALDAGAHENTVIGFVPKDALGLFALTGFDKLAQSAIDQLGTLNPDFKQVTDEIGLTSNVLSDLTGDIGIELQPGAGGPPSGALLIGTKNESSTQGFLDRLATFLSEQASGQSGEAITFQSESYKGVTIKVASGPGLGQTEIQPAYAVTAGMGIIGETPDAVEAVIDAHGGSSIATAPNFSDTFSRLDTSNNALLYADIEAIVSQLVPTGSIPPEVQSNLSRLKAAAFDVASSSDHVSVRLFFLIK
jgi:hypothetical protein